MSAGGVFARVGQCFLRPPAAGKLGLGWQPPWLALARERRLAAGLASVIVHQASDFRRERSYLCSKSGDRLSRFRYSLCDQLLRSLHLNERCVWIAFVCEQCV